MSVLGEQWGRGDQAMGVSPGVGRGHGGLRGMPWPRSSIWGGGTFHSLSILGLEGPWVHLL